MILLFFVAALIPGSFSVLDMLLRETRIVNGQTIRRGEWPFLVSLHYLKPFPFTRQTHMKHLCGGTLIHPQWVVTAGHCVGFFSDLADERSWTLVLGEHNQYLPDMGEQTIRPQQFFVYPEFRPHETNTLAHDIALIKLSTPANVSSEYVGVIPMTNETVPEYTKCMVGGWGQVSSDPYGWGMYIPLKTTLYVINTRECSDIYATIDYEVVDIQMVVDDTVLCAGIPAARLSDMQKNEGGTNDACNGDSGSPLVCPTGPDGEFQFVGIVSAGKGCGTGKYPGIYTKISHYHTWINEVMANN